jgi:hypothetical protein
MIHVNKPLEEGKAVEGLDLEQSQRKLILVRSGCRSFGKFPRVVVNQLAFVFRELGLTRHLRHRDQMLTGADQIGDFVAEMLLVRHDGPKDALQFTFLSIRNL